MQRTLLSRLAEEAERLCAGQVVRTVLCRPGSGVALVFEDASVPALDIAPGPPRPRFAATGIRLRAVEESHASLAGHLRRALGGCHLLRLRLLRGERIVRADIGEDQALILEVLGTASNLYWTDAAGRVRGRFRRIGRPGGVLRRGDAWRPPPPLPGAPSGEPSWEGPEGGAADRPGVGSRRPVAELDPLDPLAPAEVHVRADGPADEDAVFVPAERLGDALLRREFWLERHERARHRWARLGVRVRSAAARLSRLGAALRREESEAAGDEGVRRQAEAILAGLRDARRDGRRLIVPDPYDRDGSPVVIAIDPSLSNQASAERLFRRAARMKRVQREVVRKKHGLEARRAALQALATRLAEVTREAELDDIERVLEEKRSTRRAPAGGPGRKVRPAGRPKDRRARRIRRYRLVGDWHVLVGGNGPDNDYLTFRLASSHDFWLHAADYPGAHVVVRNDRRRAELPDRVLRRAAELAAYFSRAPRDLPVGVRWTQVKHVRKGRGLPAGAVLLPRFSTIVVRAAKPPGDRLLT